MILVADSGSTKTDWFLTDGDSVLKEFRTSGVNPMIQTKKLVYSQLEEVVEYTSGFEVSRICFFGAGCSEESNKDIIRGSFSSLFKSPEMIVENDLMGAAIALFGNSPGIACILGTGSNCCSYDGQSIIEARHGIGYILGDEASGAYFGKRLIRDYLYGCMEGSLSNAFDQKFGLNREQILEKVYKEENPNRFLAGFSSLLSEHLSNDYAAGVVRQGIDEFIESNVLSYHGSKESRVGFCGSVAYAFRDVIRDRMQVAGLRLGNILQRPIDGLKDHYTSVGSKRD